MLEDVLTMKNVYSRGKRCKTQQTEKIKLFTGTTTEDHKEKDQLVNKFFSGEEVVTQTQGVTEAVFLHGALHSCLKNIHPMQV